QETDQLEEEKAELESEIAELQKEKERLEFVLVAHAPACKLPFEDVGSLGAGPAEVSTLGKEDCCFAPGVSSGPPNPSYTSSFVFTHPEGATCGASHQRSSSSDQSSDSLNSPSLLAL
ncbi:Protein fosB, partial [Balearica regulorum gibbericeps]